MCNDGDRTRKGVRTDGIGMPSGEMMKVIESESGCKYLGILEADEIKQNIKERQRRSTHGKKILSSKHNVRNNFANKLTRSSSVERWNSNVDRCTEGDGHEGKRASNNARSLSSTCRY